MEMLALHELILYVFEDYISVLLCIYSVDMEMFGPHELFLYVFEDNFFVLFCIYIECMEIFGLHVLILYVLLVNLYGYFWTDKICMERPLVRNLVSHALSGSFLILFCRDISHTKFYPQQPYSSVYLSWIWCDLIYYAKYNIVKLLAIRF